MRLANQFPAACLLALLAVAEVAGDPPDRNSHPAAAALRELSGIASRRHPAALAAMERVRQRLAVRHSVEGFRDATVAAGGGYAERDPAVPALSRAFGWINDAVWLEAGVEKPFYPGFHAGIGAAGRERRAPDEGFETLAGAQVRVPLLRDRGFTLHRADIAIADHEATAEAFDALRVLSDVLRDVALRYADLQVALAQARIARAAVERSEQLLKDAEQMVELGALAAHQLHPARLETARRHEEEAAAQRAIVTARLRLEEAIGGGPLPASANAEVNLLEWAESVVLPSPEAASDWVARRPEYRAALAALRAAEARLARAREDRRSDLNAHAVVAWRADEADSNDSDGPRWAVGLTWWAPLGNRSGAGREAEARSRVAEWRERLREAEQTIAADAATARADIEAAIARLDWIRRAVETAQATLAAEQERFQLGEGASRQVLDAQKDLNDTLRRQNDIAAELLRARFRWLHATGRTPDGGALESLGASIEEASP